MVKQDERIQTLVCIACEICECDKCNIEDISQRIVNDIRAEAIEECIAYVKDNDSGCGNEWAIAKELEQLKEQK